jgi:hypothetical protein
MNKWIKPIIYRILGSFFVDWYYNFKEGYFVTNRTFPCRYFVFMIHFGYQVEFWNVRTVTSYLCNFVCLRRESSMHRNIQNVASSFVKQIIQPFQLWNWYFDSYWNFKYLEWRPLCNGIFTSNQTFDMPFHQTSIPRILKYWNMHVIGLWTTYLMVTNTQLIGNVNHKGSYISKLGRTF